MNSARMKANPPPTAATPAVTSAKMELLQRDRHLGAVLVEAGRLTLQQVEQILLAQKRLGLRFGEAGMQLGLLTEEDVGFALSRQFDFPYLQHGDSRVSAELVSALRPFTRQTETFRALRSQLMLRWLDDAPERRSIAIVSPGRGEGRTYVAANLAMVFSQLGEETLLIDADLRNPRQHAIFKLPNLTGLSTHLSERGEAVPHPVPGLPGLSILRSGPTPPNPQELLSRASFAELIDAMRNRFEIVIIDTPAAEQSADAYLIAARAGAAVIVARRNRTRLAGLPILAERIGVSRATVVGTVFNDA